jgi:hypothetical protein
MKQMEQLYEEVFFVRKEKKVTIICTKGRESYNFNQYCMLLQLPCLVTIWFIRHFQLEI